MKVAAIYDIHGNLPALEAVLDDVRHASVDEVVVGGDVFPGPMSGECLDCLLDLELPVRFIHGNGDRKVLEIAAGEEPFDVPEQFREAMRWLARTLEPRHRQEMANWPSVLRVGIDGLGPVLFCHATPRSDTEIFTRETPEARLAEAFEKVEAPLVVCGHTHMQFDRRVVAGGSEVRIVNAGSVGMPFGETGAYWALLGPKVELRRTRYELEKAAARIRAIDYPQAENFAARNVLRPPSDEEMLAAFAKAELD